jgi:hypothetical protein
LRLKAMGCQHVFVSNGTKLNKDAIASLFINNYFSHFHQY